MWLLPAKSSIGTQTPAMRRKSAPARPSRALRLATHPALLAAVLMAAAAPGLAQIDEDQLGAWYMYFGAGDLGEPGRWGVQGDAQYRNWDLGGDLEQLLLRGGLTYRPDSINALFTLGAAHITSGKFGPSNNTLTEKRIYQEALLAQQPGERVYLRHRFRAEQRWVNGQDARTRYRYALFMDIPLNGAALDPGAVYLALYNEVFINGERDIGGARRVKYFDRNRSYAALGYSLTPSLRIQFGLMRQITSSTEKNQWQLSLHHKF